MEGNKDEALRCIQIAEEAITSGNKSRALKFIKIAQRLNCDLPLDALFAKCERLKSQSTTSSTRGSSTRTLPKVPAKDKPIRIMKENGLKGEKNYMEKNVNLIREILWEDNYYMILGLEKSCSIEEIRKAYKKLSLKVHPDKNKAPGSEDAFKKISNAFRCLSDDGSRKEYDRGVWVNEDDDLNFYNKNKNHSYRRNECDRDDLNFGRRDDTCEDEFDPDDIFTFEL